MRPCSTGWAAVLIRRRSILRRLTVLWPRYHSHVRGCGECGQGSAGKVSRSGYETLRSAGRAGLACTPPLDSVGDPRVACDPQPAAVRMPAHRLTVLGHRDGGRALAVSFDDHRAERLSLPKIPTGHSKIDQLMPCRRVLTDFSH